MQEFMLTKKIQSTTTTWSPSFKASSVTLSNGNLRASLGNSGGAVFATTSKTSGKWYYEVKMTQFEGNSFQFMPMLGLASTTTGFQSPWNTNTNEMFWYYGGSGNAQFIYQTNLRLNYGSTPTMGDVIGVALDMTAKTIYYIRNGVAQPTLTWGPPNNYSSATAFYPAVSSPNSATGFGIVDWIATPQYCPSGYGLW